MTCWGFTRSREIRASKLNASTQALIGKEITLSYAERIPSPNVSEAKPVAGKNPGSPQTPSGRCE